jgi:hypothetical protein
MPGQYGTFNPDGPVGHPVLLNVYGLTFKWLNS